MFLGAVGAAKPGLASLLQGSVAEGCLQAASVAAAAAVAAPSIAHLVAPVALAEAAAAMPRIILSKPSAASEVSLSSCDIMHQVHAWAPAQHDITICCSLMLGS